MLVQTTQSGMVPNNNNVSSPFQPNRPKKTIIMDANHTPELCKKQAVKRTGFLPGQSGNPLGRPKGSKNQYTKLKSELLEVFKHKDVKAKKRLIKYLKESSDKVLLQFVKDILLPLMPKEDKKEGNVNYNYTVVRFD